MVKNFLFVLVLEYVTINVMSVKTSRIIKKETELFDPVRSYFVRMGYIVHAEVNHCDLTAIKGNELIVVELKRSFGITLLQQAVKRQRLTEFVYIAIPKPAYSRFSSAWRDLCFLVKRLELGLITVSFEGKETNVDVVITPKHFDREKSMRASKKKADKLRAEIEGRHGNYNVGGSTGIAVMTAYREKSIHIACCLKKHGTLSPKALVALGTTEKTAAILAKNYYGWFEKTGRGKYMLSEKGQDALKLYKELETYYAEVME